MVSVWWSARPVHLVDVFPANGLQDDGVDVLPCVGGRFHLEEQLETVMLVQMIKEEVVHVFIADVVNKGDTPQFGPWALLPFEDCIYQYRDFGGHSIIEVDLLVIIDCCVASFNHLDSVEESVANNGRDNVDAACRFPQIVVQLVDHGCCCCGSVWKMKHGC